MLAVMGAMLAGALAVPDAFGDGAVLFAAAYAFVRIFQLVLFGIAARNIDGLFRAILTLARGAIISPTIVLVGAVSGWGPLEAWWAGTLLLEYGWLLVMDVSGWWVSPGHFSERHGLIFIIALGEAVISIGIGAAGLGIGSKVVIPAMMGLGIIVAMWWTYFDVNALAAERHLKTLSGIPQVRLAQQAYMFFHLPMIMGAIFFSLGVKKTLAHTDDVLAIIPAVALVREAHPVSPRTGSITGEMRWVCGLAKDSCCFGTGRFNRSVGGDRGVGPALSREPRIRTPRRL